MKATREQQHPLAAEPGGEGCFEGLMDRPAAAHQLGGAGPDAVGVEGGFCRSDKLWMAAQAEVVIAGQIQQRHSFAHAMGMAIPIPIGCVGFKLAGTEGLVAAQPPQPLGGKGLEAANQVVLPVGDSSLSHGEAGTYKAILTLAVHGPKRAP